MRKRKHPNPAPPPWSGCSVAAHGHYRFKEETDSNTQTCNTERQRPTCLVREPEGHHLVRDAADIPHRGDAAVIRVVLRSEVLQLQDLCFSLRMQERPLGRDRGTSRDAGDRDAKSGFEEARGRCRGRSLEADVELVQKTYFI